MLRFLFCLGLLSVAFAEIPASAKVTAAVKDTHVNGIEGFNLNLVAPFKFQEYIVGFRYALGNFRKAPESLFLKRAFETPGEGVATLNADYDLSDNSLNLAARWSSDAFGVALEVDGDTNRKLKTVGLSKSLNIKENKLTVSGAYDVLKKKILGCAVLDAEATKVQVKYDTESKDPVLAVSRSLDDKNEISPAIKLRTGEISYGYKRKWHGGSLFTKYFPGEKVTMEWKDEGASGVWTTTAEVPLADTSATKVSFSREWNY